MRKKLLTTLLLSTLAVTSNAAVSLSQTGKGDFIVLPYYSVKNNMNTTYTVVNHSSTHGKLVQISFKEAKNNQDVLFYNVFLKPNSSWAAGLGAVDSTIPGHTGEPSIAQFNNSDQCAPFLAPLQEFLPYAFETEVNASLSMERAQEGHVEVHELGSIDPANAAIDLDDCGSLSENINNDSNFLIQQLTPSTGEISVTGSLLNVVEGTSYSYNGTAFHNFTDQTVSDLAVFPYVRYFDDASTTALINVDGSMVETTWNSGEEAMNALISSQRYDADYTVELGVNAQTELVLSMPGKIFMTNGDEAKAPFTETFSSMTGSCETAGFSAFDRNGESINNVSNLDLCWGINVVKINAQSPSELTDVLMSQHEISVTPDHTNSQAAGRVNLNFNQTMNSTNGYQVEGLPVLGFSVQRLTNANAAPNILAQYGSLFRLTQTQKVSSLP